MKKILLLLFLCFSLPLCTQSFAQGSGDQIAGALNDLNNLTADQKREALALVGMPDASGFSMAKIFAWIIFGSVGFIAFVYGKKQEELKPLFVGLALMVYPYFFTRTLWLYIIGIILCGALYFWRD